MTVYRKSDALRDPAILSLLKCGQVLQGMYARADCAKQLSRLALGVVPAGTGNGLAKTVSGGGVQNQHRFDSLFPQELVFVSVLFHSGGLSWLRFDDLPIGDVSCASCFRRGVVIPSLMSPCCLDPRPGQGETDSLSLTLSAVEVKSLGSLHIKTSARAEIDRQVGRLFWLAPLHTLGRPEEAAFSPVSRSYFVCYLSRSAKNLERSLARSARHFLLPRAIPGSWT